MGPYRSVGTFPKEVYEVERPFFPHVGEVVRICVSGMCPWSSRKGHFGYVQMISDGGYYFVSFPRISEKFGEIDYIEQREGAGIFSILELQEPR